MGRAHISLPHHSVSGHEFHSILQLRNEQTLSIMDDAHRSEHAGRQLIASRLAELP